MSLAMESHSSELPNTLLESQRLQASDKCVGAVKNKEASIIKRAQELIGHFASGAVELFLEGVKEDVHGSMFRGLVPGSDAFYSKMQLAQAVGQLKGNIRLNSCEARNWRIVGEEVFFNVAWDFVWSTTGESVLTIGLARVAIRNDMICEIYHVANVDQDASAALEESQTMKRVREIASELENGNYDRYMGMVVDDVKASVLGGLIQDADTITNKMQLKQVLGNFDTYMDIKKLKASNFCQLTSNEVMYNVEWEFVWKPSGKFVSATAVVRDVLCGDMLAETYHLVDVKHMSRGWYHM